MIAQSWPENAEVEQEFMFLNTKKEEYKFRALWVILKEREKILQYARYWQGHKF